MSEVQSRPSGSRGRGGYRGGRGGYRGARGNGKSHTKPDEQESLPTSEPEEQGEVGELKKKYGDRVSILRELCDGWSDEDLVYALKETNGDANLAFERISTGTISQWGEVGKKKNKAKDSSTIDTAAGGRGGRGRGIGDSRGRGRGAERSRGTRVARAGAQSNGTKPTTKTVDDSWGEPPAPTPAATSWDNPTNGDIEKSTATWEEPTTDTPTLTGNESTDAATAAKKSRVNGWAGLFAKPPPVQKKAAIPISVTKLEEATPMPGPEDTLLVGGMPPPIEEQITSDGPSELPEASADETPITLTPSKDELTESNVEQLPDVSQPPVSATAASTVASTADPLNTTNTTTPAIRPGMSGYAASALKATSGSGRTASFQRRIMEQQEAVVMPGNHAVDRAAVQFGSMGLNGDPHDPDVDEDREEPETRMQLPDDSPAAPKASLPLLPNQAQATASVQDYSEPHHTQRHAPGLPPVAAQHQQSTSPNISTDYADQYSRYGQSAPKAYDPFAQQPPQSQPAASQAQEPFSAQLPTSSQQTTSSIPNDYSQYYSANPREAHAQAQAYQQYYSAGYGQNQESQQRSGSAFGSSNQDAQSQYVTSRPQQNYGQQDVSNSGHNTPNSMLQGHQAQHSGHMPQGQGGYGQYGYGYPNAYNQQYPQYAGQYGGNYMGQMGGRYGSNRPAFDDVRRQAGAADTGPEHHQANAYGYGYNKQQQYAGGNYGQTSMYGQPSHQYSAYEHSASPANAGGYSQSGMQGRETMYGRTGSAQPSEGQQAASGNAFGGPTPDPFGRSHSGFQGKTAQAEDPAKPSPSIAANRPSSDINSGMTNQQQQSGQAGSFPPPHSQPGGNQAFGGYPQYGNQQTTHHQAQGNHAQTAAYGGYGFTAAFSQYGGGYGSGRGWNGHQYGSSAH